MRCFIVIIIISIFAMRLNERANILNYIIKMMMMMMIVEGQVLIFIVLYHRVFNGQTFSSTTLARLKNTTTTTTTTMTTNWSITSDSQLGFKRERVTEWRQRDRETEKKEWQRESIREIEMLIFLSCDKRKDLMLLVFYFVMPNKLIFASTLASTAFNNNNNFNRSKQY